MNDLEKRLAFRATCGELSYLKQLSSECLPTFSVVIPSFNQAEFLSETIESVLAQNYPKLEIFVADGGSSDGSVDILSNYQQRLGSFFRFESKPDGGHYHGVNKGIARTSGPIIAWINSDDVYLPDTFWKIAAFFYFNRGAFIVYGRNRYVDRNLHFVTEYPVDWSPLLREQKRRMLHFCLPPQPSLFFKRDAVTLCGPLDSKILDYELWLRWQANLPFYFYDDHLSLSRLHGEAITANADGKLIKAICEVVHRYYAIVPYSWALRYAYNQKYGAAWAKGENPPVDRAIQAHAWFFWLSINLKKLPVAIASAVRSLNSLLRQALRASA